MAQHRTASHVVQRALTYSDDQGQGLIVQALIQSQGETSLLKVATGRYGSFVVVPRAEMFILHIYSSDI